jgi:hypothetical protein
MQQLEAVLVQCVGELGRGVVVLDGEVSNRDFPGMADTLEKIDLLVALASGLVRDALRWADS